MVRLCPFALIPGPRAWPRSALPHILRGLEGCRWPALRALRVGLALDDHRRRRLARRFERDRRDAWKPSASATDQPDPGTTGPVSPLDAMRGRARWIAVLAWDCNRL